LARDRLRAVQDLRVRRTQRAAVRAQDDLGVQDRDERVEVAVVRERGYEPVSIARSLGVDVITGDGLEGALEGVSCIVDVATGPSPVEEEATRLFTTLGSVVVRDCISVTNAKSPSANLFERSAKRDSHVTA
jgi:hypothetical protein